MVQDLRSFLADYGDRYPEEILTIDEPVDVRYEGTAIIAELENQKRFPVVIFRDVRSNGKKLDMPVITWEHASRLRMARLLNAPVDRAGVACYEAMNNPVQPVVIDRADAPVAEVVTTGDAVDLGRLPAFVHHEMDPGPYITAGFLTTFDPDSRRDNASLQRGWISGPREIRFHFESHKHNAINLAKHEERQEPMPIAFWIGHHPLGVLGTSIRVPYDGSHYAMGGSFLGEPMRLTPSHSLGDDFLVPADAEIVIEGMVALGERKPEGPFGEYTRHMGQQRWNPFMNVTAVTHRKDAYWQTVMCGYTHWISSLRGEGKIFSAVKDVVPGVKNIHLAMSGAGQFNIYIQLHQTTPGQSRLALITALTAHPQSKNAFVFDEDVDIFNDKDVLIAFSTRFQGDRDLVALNGILGPALDPSAPSGGNDLRITKMGFDCTKPVGRSAFAPRISIPQDVKDRLDLSRYVSPDRLNEIPFEIYG